MVELKAAIHQIQHKIIHLRSIGENSSGRKCAQRHWKTLEMQSKGMHIEESTMVTFRRYRSRLLDLPQLSVLLKKINTSILPEDVIKSDVCINTASSIKPEDVIKSDACINAASSIKPEEVIISDACINAASSIKPEEVIISDACINAASSIKAVVTATVKATLENYVYIMLFGPLELTGKFGLSKCNPHSLCKPYLRSRGTIWYFRRIRISTKLVCFYNYMLT